MVGAVEGGRRPKQRLGEGGVKGEGALVTHRQHDMSLSGEDLVSYVRQHNGGQGLCFLGRHYCLFGVKKYIFFVFSFFMPDLACY